MSFEASYSKILYYAKNAVQDRRLTIEAEDLVNEAYLLLYDKPFDIKAYFKEIKNLSHVEKAKEKAFIQYEDAYTKVLPEETSKYCPSCKETIPIYGFNKKQSREFVYSSNHCKACIASQARAKRALKPKIERPKKPKKLTRKEKHTIMMEDNYIRARSIINSIRKTA
jgi:hypothetical protein